MLLLAGVLVSLLLVELGLRLAGISYPRLYLQDALVGSTFRPGISFQQHDEGNAFVEINSLGYRDVEWSQVKSSDTVRIAVLGDSFVAAIQVDRQYMFTTLLEERLSACGAFGSLNVEVMNFGVSGYGTAQEYLTLKGRVWPYAPDFVIVAFLTGNDILDNSAALKRRPGVPYFIYREGRLVLDTSSRKSKTAFRAIPRAIARKLIDHFRVAQVVNRAYQTYFSRKASSAHRAPSDAIDPLEPGLHYFVYVPSADPNWHEAWDITEELLRKIRDEIIAHDAKMLVVTLTNSIQVDLDTERKRASLERLGTKDFSYPDLRIAAAGRRDGFPVFNLLEPFQQHAERNDRYLHGFVNSRLGIGHWNKDAHRLAAQLIAERIAADVGQAPCPSDMD